MSSIKRSPRVTVAARGPRSAVVGGLEPRMPDSDTSIEMEETLRRKPYQLMRGHTSSVYGVVYLRNGGRITCSDDGSLRLWDQESGTQIGNEWREDEIEESVWTVALSPDGKTVAAGSRDGTVRLWDIETRKVAVKWNGHSGEVNSICWSADVERVMTASDDGTVRVWDVESGETVLGPIETGHSQIFAVAYSPDSSKFATGGHNEDAIQIRDARTGKLLSTLRLDQIVWSLAWTSDQKKLIAGCGNGPIRIFNTATWEQVAVLEDHYALVNAIVLFQNDRLLASGSFDNTARLWNLDTSLPVGPPLQHQDCVCDVALSADGKFLLAACEDKNAYVWDTHTILQEAGLEDLLSPSNSIMDSDATPRPIELEDTHELPEGFFNDPRVGVDVLLQSSTHRTHPPPPEHRYPHAVAPPLGSSAQQILSCFSPLFRGSQSNTIVSTELQQFPAQHATHNDEPPIVEVAEAHDKQPLYVAPPPKQTGDKTPKRLKHDTWWARCLLFILCHPIPKSDRDQ